MMEIQRTPTKGHALEPFIYKIVIDYGYDEKKAKRKKLEIEKAIATYRLVKKRVNAKNNDLGSWYNYGCFGLLKSYLNGEEYSGLK